MSHAEWHLKLSCKIKQMVSLNKIKDTLFVHSPPDIMPHSPAKKSNPKVQDAPRHLPRLSSIWVPLKQWQSETHVKDAPKSFWGYRYFWFRQIHWWIRHLQKFVNKEDKQCENNFPSVPHALTWSSEDIANNKSPCYQTHILSPSQQRIQ